MKFSDEQMLVINSDKQHIVVNAGPGSGKTTLLLGIVQHRKEEKHLILCFNASIKEEIKSKLIKQNITNAEVHTFHSLAFDFFSRTNNYIKGFSRRKLNDNLDFFSMFKILKEINLVSDFDDEKIGIILEAFRNYLQSDKKLEFFYYDNQEIMNFCKKVMSYLINNPKAPMFHEVYIKMYQLINPYVLFDSILVDEYQDVSECYLSVINSISKNKKSVRVGDTYQKIYGYNGAIGMSECDFKLTKSFRIGQENGVFCNYILEKFFKNVIQLQGVRETHSILPLDKTKPYTKIYRTNVTLIKELIQFVRQGKKIKVSQSIIDILEVFSHLIKINKHGIYYYKDIRVEDTFNLSILYLQTRDRTLKKYFEIYDEFTKEELKEFFKIYKNYVINEETEESFNIHLITAHRCKGLEFEAVKLADDFIELEKIEEISKEDNSLLDEIYVLFVSLTRSNKYLELNEDLKEVFKEIKEYENSY